MEAGEAGGRIPRNNRRLVRGGLSRRYSLMCILKENKREKGAFLRGALWITGRRD